MDWSWDILYLAGLLVAVFGVGLWAGMTATRKAYVAVIAELKRAAWPELERRRLEKNRPGGEAWGFEKSGPGGDSE